MKFFIHIALDVFGAEALVEQEVFEGGHRFWGKRGLPFMAQHLGV